MKHWSDQMSALVNFGPPPWKLNVGCGRDHLGGFINIDKEPKSKADLCFDIEQPWMALPSKCVSGIVAKHVLEHLNDIEMFFKEAYRVMLPDAILEIKVPHPRSDSYLGDPTHVRPILRNTLDLLSRRNCAFFAEGNWANTPLAVYWDVDFECISQEFILHDSWKDKFEKDTLIDDIMYAIDTFNNVANEINFTLKRIKETE